VEKTPGRGGGRFPGTILRWRLGLPGGTAIRHVLPVLWTTSYLRITGFTSHSTQNRSFRRRFSQPVDDVKTWLDAEETIINMQQKKMKPTNDQLC